MVSFLDSTIPLLFVPLIPRKRGKIWTTIVVSYIIKLRANVCNVHKLPNIDVASILWPLDRQGTELIVRLLGWPEFLDIETV